MGDIANCVLIPEVRSRVRHGLHVTDKECGPEYFVGAQLPGIPPVCLVLPQRGGLAQPKGFFLTQFLGCSSPGPYGQEFPC